MIDYENGWKTVHPNAQPYYDRKGVDFALTDAKEVCAEWDYGQDPHGYCHDRSTIVALIAEVERLRELEARLREAVTDPAFGGFIKPELLGEKAPPRICADLSLHEVTICSCPPETPGHFPIQIKEHEH